MCAQNGHLSFFAKTLKLIKTVFSISSAIKMFLSFSRFFPGVLPDPPISASPGKRRSQSLSALPKDDKTSPGKVHVSTYSLKNSQIY